jgi:UDPglucose--hexose-1-phosphate uridylyltransferase
MLSGICSALAEYAVSEGLLSGRDRQWAVNALMDALGADEYFYEPVPTLPLGKLLDAAVSDAVARKVCANTPADRERLECRLMGILTPRPSQVEDEFWRRYRESPEKATDYYHALGVATGYIREDLAAKNPRWTVDTAYGALEITVNLSKPEKDPRDIAAARKRGSDGGVPACALCAENEGYGGRPGFTPRQNHRLISLELGGEPWALQYSPYVYYDQHCIVLDRRHTPMRISRETFRNLLDFTGMFPHYFVGSNADLPIVGGSILTHNHFQGGRHTFAMERAAVGETFTFPGFPDVKCGVLDWPLTVLRLAGGDPERIAALAERILDAWRVYSDPALRLFAQSRGTPHHTVTPIARRHGGTCRLDLVLRSNITSPEHPLGVFHPHEELHHIKKENIGLIEVMGLAVLPGRLDREMSLLRDAMCAGDLNPDDPDIGKHVPWAREILARRDFGHGNADGVLREEIGRTFLQVLSQCAVFPKTRQGTEGLGRFLSYAEKH